MSLPQKPDLVVDIVKLGEIFYKIQSGKISIPIGEDTLLYAVRVATGLPQLEITKEQRQQVKQLLHGQAYSMSPTNFMKMLKRQEKKS